jgi:hypothetical protein
MHSELKAQSSEPFALRKKPDGQHMLANSSLASDGFNIWWQKTAAQNMATVAEASDLMRILRLIGFASQPRARHAH